MPIPASKTGADERSAHPLTRLPPEDLQLIAELVLCSGSLKDLAAKYQVSYPTIRQRLDRVIEHLRAVIDGEPVDPHSELLATMIERGEISISKTQALRRAHREVLKSSGHNQSPSR